MKSKSNYRRFATSAEQYVPRRAAVLTAGVVAAQCPPKRGCAMLKHRGFAAFALCAIECVIATGGLILSHSAQAADGALPKDRAAIEACLKKQPDNRDACINAVYTPCTGTPEGGSTVGMEDCAARELAVCDGVECELDGVVAVGVRELHLHDRARPGLDHRDRGDSPGLGIEDLGHAELSAENSLGHFRKPPCQTQPQKVSDTQRN